MASPVRYIATQVLTDVSQHGRSLGTALTDRISKHKLSARDKGLVQELCYGSLRQWFRLQPLVRSMLDKPLKPKDADIQAVLVVGAYQLLHTRIPDHAALSETVAVVDRLRKTWYLLHFQRDSQFKGVWRSPNGAGLNPRQGQAILRLSEAASQAIYP